jgi:hypothetical protein
VQEYGLQLLMISDNTHEQDRRVEALKLTLVGHDPAHWFKRLFPELVGPAPTTNGKVAGQTVRKDEDLSDTEGAWQFTDTPTPEEAEAIMAELMGNPTGRLTAMDLDEMVEEEGWT